MQFFSGSPHRPGPKMVAYSQAIFIDNQEDSSRHLFFIYFSPFFGVGGGINQDQGKSNLACHTRRSFTALQELWPQMSGGLYGQIFVLGVTHLGDKKGILEFVAYMYNPFPLILTPQIINTSGSFYY